MLHTTGMLKMLLYAAPRVLTVLNYHRVNDASKPGFDTFRANVSASPSAFRRQMEYVKLHYHVIRCEGLARWLKGQCDLPPRAALITFDDGYTDNLTNAYPVLRELGLPGTIFLCTGHVGTGLPFYWDFAAYCFARAQNNSAELPITGSAAWKDVASRDDVEKQWVERVKRLDEDERSAALEELARALHVQVPSDAFGGLYLTWDQVRELRRHGIEMGAHTVSHPILGAVPLDTARSEVVASKERIEAETGKPVISFAYPNGGWEDISPAVVSMLRGTGIELAFTLMPGPTRYSSVRRAPFAIRRIFVSRYDTLDRFAAKLAGALRLR